MGLDITKIGHFELEKFVSLAASHQRNRRSRENFFSGKIPRSDLGAGMPQELDLFHSELNYAHMTVDALLDRMQLEELRCGNKQAQLAAQAIWERSGMREQAHLGFQESFEHGLSVGVVGPDPSGRATITLHTSVGWHVEMHPVTRELAGFTGCFEVIKTKEGTVLLRGWVPAGTGGAVAAWLPESFRPATLVSGGAQDAGNGRWTITPAGAVTFHTEGSFSRIPGVLYRTPA